MALFHVISEAEDVRVLLVTHLAHDSRLGVGHDKVPPRVLGRVVDSVAFSTVPAAIGQGHHDRINV